MDDVDGDHAYVQTEEQKEAVQEMIKEQIMMQKKAMDEKAKLVQGKKQAQDVNTAEQMKELNTLAQTQDDHDDECGCDACSNSHDAECDCDSCSTVQPVKKDGKKKDKAIINKHLADWDRCELLDALSIFEEGDIVGITKDDLCNEVPADLDFICDDVLQAANQGLDITQIILRSAFRTCDAHLELAL